MAIVLNRFDGGEVDFLSARDLADNQFQKFRNMRGDHITKAVKALANVSKGGTVADSYALPGQGFFEYRAEWDNSATPRQVSTLYKVLARIVKSVGAWEINIHRFNTKNVTGAADTEFIDETAAKGGWERATSNRLVEGVTNITFAAATDRISGHANLENYEVGEIIRVLNTTDNDGYYKVKTKKPAASSVDVHEALTDEAGVSAYLYPLPDISMFAIRGDLRVSNGNFYDTTHDSLWEGHIKRDFWGQGVTYGTKGGRFSQPPMKEAYNNWKLQDQELVAPTIIAGDRTGQNTAAANQIAIHIAGTHPADWPDKAVDVEWNARDRVAFTYVYDFVQESELSRATNGGIGLPMGTIVTAADARAFMVEAYTGAANISWNRRVTAIRMYYQFYDDPDWYEVVTLDTNKGWSKSGLPFDVENTGYWIPIMDGTIDNTGTTDAAGGTGTTVNDNAHGLAVDDMVYFLNTATIEPGSLITKPSSFAPNTMTLPVAMVDSLGVNPANYNDLDWCAGDRSATAVATFYIPFTGEKAFTYFTNTGRAAAVKVPAIRWRACDTDGSKVLYGNIDTKDENEQTIRERSRVIETQPGMPDIALLSMSKEIGLYSGDEIISIVYFNRSWWVLMERSVVVLQPGTLKELARYNGVGSKWSHANAATPFGLCVADESAITLFPAFEELTLPKRKSYQSLTLFEPTMAYSMKRKRLFIIPDTRGSALTEIWVYSFETKSWSTETISSTLVYGNFVSIGSWGGSTVTAIHNEPEGLVEGIVADRISTLQLGNLFSGNSETGEIKTKEYHNETPYLDKIFGNGYLSYKSSAQELLVEVYRDGESIPFKTIHLDAASSLINVPVPLNVQCKLLALNFKGTANTLEVEEFIVPDSEITTLDR